MTCAIAYLLLQILPSKPIGLLNQRDLPPASATTIANEMPLCKRAWLVLNAPQSQCNQAFFCFAVDSPTDIGFSRFSGHVIWLKSWFSKGYPQVPLASRKPHHDHSRTSCETHDLSFPLQATFCLEIRSYASGERYPRYECNLTRLCPTRYHRFFLELSGVLCSLFHLLPLPPIRGSSNI